METNHLFIVVHNSVDNDLQSIIFKSLLFCPCKVLTVVLHDFDQISKETWKLSDEFNNRNISVVMMLKKHKHCASEVMGRWKNKSKNGKRKIALCNVTGLLKSFGIDKRVPDSFVIFIKPNENTVSYRFKPKWATSDFCHFETCDPSFPTNITEQGVKNLSTWIPKFHAPFSDPDFFIHLDDQSNSFWMNVFGQFLLKEPSMLTSFLCFFDFSETISIDKCETNSFSKDKFFQLLHLPSDLEMQSISQKGFLTLFPLMYDIFPAISPANRIQLCVEILKNDYNGELCSIAIQYLSKNKLHHKRSVDDAQCFVKFLPNHPSVPNLKLFLEREGIKRNQKIRVPLLLFPLMPRSKCSKCKKKVLIWYLDALSNKCIKCTEKGKHVIPYPIRMKNCFCIRCGSFFNFAEYKFKHDCLLSTRCTCGIKYQGEQCMNCKFGIKMKQHIKQIEIRQFLELRDSKFCRISKHLAYDVQNETIITEIDECIKNAKIFAKPCLFCQEPTNNGCLSCDSFYCEACLMKWINQNSPGKLFKVANNRCPSCKRITPHSKIEPPSDQNYAICSLCNHFLPLPSTGCSEEREEIRDFICESCVPLKQFRRCPKCLHGVIKNGGCNDMECFCKHRFCYRCGKSRSEHDSYPCS